MGPHRFQVPHLTIQVRDKTEEDPKGMSKREIGSVGLRQKKNQVRRERPDTRNEWPVGREMRQRTRGTYDILTRTIRLQQKEKREKDRMEDSNTEGIS